MYDSIIPASFAWKVEGSGGLKSPKKVIGLSLPTLPKKAGGEDTELIPLLQHLVDGESLDPGWHRTKERLSRGIRPAKALSVQLEPWEKQLAVMEMALIAGTDTKHLTQQKVTKVLAHAWGREKGFHKIMLEHHCSRRGDLARKKRADAGVPLTDEQKAAMKEKSAAKKRKFAVLEQNPLEPQQLAAYEAAPALPVPAGEAPMEVAMGEQAGHVVEEHLQPPLEEPQVEVQETWATV